MSVKLDGVALSLQPSVVSWEERDTFSTASGFPFYPRVRILRMRFDAMSPSEWGELISFFNNHRTTTGTVEVPDFTSGTSQLFNAIPLEPVFDSFFEGQYRDVSFRLLVLI